MDSLFFLAIGIFLGLAFIKSMQEEERLFERDRQEASKRTPEEWQAMYPKMFAPPMKRYYEVVDEE